MGLLLDLCSELLSCYADLVITKLITAMANPFFSGRIPPGLAIQIDAHLLNTGETRSELLVRLLRYEISDNKSNNIADDKSDDVITSLLSRVERLEQLIDNKPNNISDNKSTPIEVAAVSKLESEVVMTMESLAKRLKVSEKTLRAGAASDESWRKLMEAKPDPESLQWSRPVKVGRVWRIACVPAV